MSSENGDGMQDKERAKTNTLWMGATSIEEVCSKIFSRGVSKMGNLICLSNIESYYKRKPTLFIEFTDLKKEVKRFLFNTNIDNRSSFDCILKIADARRNFDMALIIIKGNVEPEHNSYIQTLVSINTNPNIYQNFLENLGRISSRLNESTKKFEDVKNADFYQKPLSPFLVESNRNLLATCMETLVINPIKKAHAKFLRTYYIDSAGKLSKKIEDKVIDKDKELFYYFVFLEMLHASEVLGAWTMEKGKFATSQTYTLPETPSNPKTKKVAIEDGVNPYDALAPDWEVTDEVSS
ncbi:MAG: hypothetical protein Q8N05_16145 [Bacteroidota bacterium]|nr:hypothetical protein [Bacteroidota bacterium]